MHESAYFQLAFIVFVDFSDLVQSRTRPGLVRLCTAALSISNFPQLFPRVGLQLL